MVGSKRISLFSPFVYQALNMKKTLYAVAFLTLFSGCSIQKMAGEAVIEYTHDQAVPYLMAQGDLTSACQMGQSLGPVVASFSRVELQPQNVGIATNMAAGMCAEFDQRTAELARLRALHENRTAEAQDALIREKQGHRLAALRMIQAYENAMMTFGDMSHQCRTFENTTDELLSLLGLASGALGLLHEFNSEKSVGISLEVTSIIEKSASCFDDDKWWGLPTALRAALWLSIPGAGPEGVDPIQAMQDAAKKGDAQGVLLARAMLVMMANTIGKSDIMCQALAEIPDAQNLNPEYALLNAYATSMMTHQADIAWTKEKGHRSPFMQIQCPAAQSAPMLEQSQMDDLLDGLFDEEEDTAETSEQTQVLPDTTPQTITETTQSASVAQ